MKLYIVKLLWVFVFVIFDICIGKSSNTLSLLEINKIRSAKTSQSRLFNGKNVLLGRLGDSAVFFVNGVTDMANRFGCDPNMHAAAKRALGKKSAKSLNLIASACEVKSREE